MIQLWTFFCRCTAQTGVCDEFTAVFSAPCLKRGCRSVSSLLPEWIRHARDHHRSRCGPVSHHRQLHSVWSLPLLQGNSGFPQPSSRGFASCDTTARRPTSCVCFDVGVFTRVHQPAAVRLLLRPGRPGAVSHDEVNSGLLSNVTNWKKSGKRVKSH